jgi:Transposase
MEVVYRRCCGIDVHKDSITACVLVNEAGKERSVRKKQFRTYWKDLQRLRFWLLASKVEKVAMESTGVYWKPIWNVLEGQFPLLLANPYHMHNHSGREDRRQRQRVDRGPAGARTAAGQFRASAPGAGTKGSYAILGEVDRRTESDP